MAVVKLFTLVLILGANAGTIPIDRAAEDGYQRVLQKAHTKFQKECIEDPRGPAAEKCRDQERAQELHAFDQRISDRLPFDRPIPDTRAALCGKKEYSVTSTVSVVIPFHHEATSTLVRTATSVLKQTPEALLKDVVIVSDGASSAPWAAKQARQLAKFASKNPKVKIVTLDKHLGLAPAKTAGARASEGDIVAFLDSHCEVNVGWYEPLAEAIEEDRGTIANPIIDGISSSDFTMHGTTSFTRGVFTWGMYFAGEPFNSSDQRALERGVNVATPAQPGGLFAVDRAYFEKLGYYDDGLRVWGGENIELSLKAWRCGGRVLFVPCSRVGHVYKAVNHRFPAGESLHKNYKRIAEVWLDDYRDIYYQSFPQAMMTPAGDLTEAHAVRARLNCKSMSWFIENVYPTMYVPRPAYEEGMLRSTASHSCIDTNRAEIASNPMQVPHVLPAALNPCNPYSDHNQWYFQQKTNWIVHIGIWIEECLGVQNKQVVVCQCAKYSQGGCRPDEIVWKRTEDGLGIVHTSSGMCLESGSSPGSPKLQVTKCGPSKKAQGWRFVNRSAEGHDEL